jgi:hypothetical protein
VTEIACWYRIGVSRHHLRVEGYVTIEAEDTPHPRAIIRSARPAIANVPKFEAEVRCTRRVLRHI